MRTYARMVGWLVLATMVLWLGSPQVVAQDLSDSWVFDVPETAGMGPDSGYANDYEAAIYDACARHGCSGDQLVGVMYCESGGDPNAVGNHGEIGLFQIKPWIWTSVDPWDPYASIEFAAMMFASGQGGNWVCQG